MAIWQPKRTLVSEDNTFGLCVWRLPNGNYIQNSEGDYLNIQARVGDKLAEQKITKAANELGFMSGKPWWLPGFRQVSQSEHEDQMERLIDGKIPDPVDIWRGMNDKNGR